MKMVRSGRNLQYVYGPSGLTETLSVLQPDLLLVYFFQMFH